MAEKFKTLALFCHVVDNYGDIGICWRLARQFAHEHGLEVTLWVDDLVSFRRICPAVDTGAQIQLVDQVRVRHWRAEESAISVDGIADIVIEFFGCNIPEAYIAAMAQRSPRPAWFNLEGLTAEEWVEGCHLLPSTHPRLPLTKYFFFPGFTAKTGGLWREAGLLEQRAAFGDAQNDAFLAGLGLTTQERAGRKASLFCYPHAPVSDLFATWRDAREALTCLVPEGVAAHAVDDFLGRRGQPGAVATQGALTVRVIPFLPQPDYDRLLWSCDVNFVRGEDSFVRAQWAGAPFVWHIYPQDEDLHLKKLRAFLACYAPGLDGLTAFSLAWNGATAPAASEWPQLWDGLISLRPRLRKRAAEWQLMNLQNGELCENLLNFARRLDDAGQISGRIAG